MKKKVTALVILLVGVSMSTAHVANSSAFTEGWSTTSSTTSLSDEASKQSAADEQSVVVNRSLVCEDLCGAGYGGPACNQYCVPAKASQYADSSGLHSLDLCPRLCPFGLGGSICGCSHGPPGRSNRFKDICSVLCSVFQRNFKGCTICPPKIEKPTKPASESTRDMPATTEPTKTDTTISSTSPAEFNSPPDWHEVCKYLCKQGEGGALCNCDLPPLYRIHNS